MTTLNYLQMTHDEMYAFGDEIMTRALSQKPYNEEAHRLFKEGLAIVQCAIALWPLLHLYRAHESSYWALLRLAR